ncbi:hypothetical protein [Streptomyces sp. NPDC047123]|uniref:hypothetical protein n=1 Tax=Streptomyces sp. NPDC047123 TaxID=3155622 RepID=UPI0033E2CAC9
MLNTATSDLQGLDEIKVALVDDRKDALTRTCDLLEDLPLSVESMLLRETQTLDSVLKEIRERGCNALISDHRLRHQSHVGFDGAELVYRANEKRLPAILYSAYVEDDEATTIREWRYFIPRVVEKGPGSVKVIPGALRAAKAESDGVRPLERRGFLTPIRIVDIHRDSGYPTVEVAVTAWKPDARVTIPATRLPVTHRKLVPGLIGQIFLGEVNFYAEEESELFFHKLRPAPEIPSDWKSE